MSADSHSKRRDFLKTAAAGAAGAVGITAFPFKFDKVFAQTTGGVWVNGMQINPCIDNKRVVFCNDPTMFSSPPPNTSFAGMNSTVNAAKVASNLDAMAMQLTQKTTAAEAWSTIFRSSKPWASTRVAMKTNGIGGSTTNRPRAAIYKKLCDVLIGQLGVQPANILLYDACDDASQWYTSAYVSLTDSAKIRAGVSVRAAGLGGFSQVTITNAAAADGPISCPADLVNGNIDILVNVAACKMHNGTGGHYNYGSCTLCMKNHLGTFTDGTRASHSDGLHVPNNGATPPPPPLALFEINKHSAILGGNPVRQQLCIVDALLSNGASGAGGGWDNQTNMLAMGTFAPILDYLACKNILLNSTVMKSSPIPAQGVTNAGVILPYFLTEFGYAETDALLWLDALGPAVAGPSGCTGTGGSGGAGGGGASGSAGTGGGGTSASTSMSRGGTTGSGGTGSGGTSASTSAGSGGTSASTSVGGGGSSASAGAGGGGTSGSAGAGGGGTTTASGTTVSGGTTSGAGGMGGSGPASSSTLASGGSPATGGTSSAGTRVTTSSGGGCDIGGVERTASRWGAILALGAVVAGKLRSLVKQQETHTRSINPGEQAGASGNDQATDEEKKA